MDILDIGLYAIYLLLTGAVIVSIVLPLVNLIKDPRSLVKTGIVAAVFILIFFGAYAMSDSAVTPKHISLGVHEGASKLIGAGLVLLYVFLFGSILGIVYSEINKLIK